MLFHDHRLYIYRVFPTVGGWGGPPPTSHKFAHFPPLRKMPPSRLPTHQIFIATLTPTHPPPQKNVSSPLTKQQFSSYNPIKIAFLAVVLLLLHFSFNFILFGHTGYVNFDFQLMFSIHRKQFLALKKVRIVKITPPQVSFARQKKFSPVKFPILP